MAHVFVGLPKDFSGSKDGPYEKVSLYDAAGKSVRQVLWGDWLSLAEPEDIPEGKKNTKTWLWVRWSWSSKDPAKRQVLKIRREYTSPERPLEIIFVDVGQGDGCVLISPERGVQADREAAGEAIDVAAGGEERIMVIDAGKYGHMGDFLEGRFKAYRNGFDFHAAIITHPDHDHYNGFNYLLKKKSITFKHVYHNGIAEFNGEEDLERIGGTRTSAQDSRSYLKRIIVTHDQMKDAFETLPAEAKSYGKLINRGFVNENVGEYKMLGVNVNADPNGQSWVPGFEPGPGRPYSIEVLGPWVEHPFGADDPTLRIFADDLGKTKNGHSVLLRLQYNNFSVFFGGDLNQPSERFLLQMYGGKDAWPAPGDEMDEMLAAAGPRLSSDVMKSCHHGSSDVTDEFIEAVNPAAFIISSGDQDANYVHPRPDLLGRLGRLGKGDSPVLLSTELQRSTREIDTQKQVRSARRQLEKLVDCKAADHAADDFEDKRKAEVEKLLDKLSQLDVRSVAVDGAIYIKTDGNWLMAAFKKETTDAKSKWFYYMYRLSGSGEFELLPRPGSH